MENLLDYQNAADSDITMPVITIETVLSVFKGKSDKKSLAQIKQSVVSKVTPSGMVFNPFDNEIREEVARIVKEDQAAGPQSELVYSSTSKSYAIRRSVSQLPLCNTDAVSTLYSGTAGECAVMSELLFRGYNVNRMAVDEGVDLVATKNNLYFYIQVKETRIKPNGTFIWMIDKFRFNQFIEMGLRYILVGRYGDKNDSRMDRTIFFKFDPSTLSNAIYQGCILDGVKGLSIKVKFDSKTGEPILYNENKEMNVGFYKNNFDL